MLLLFLLGELYCGKKVENLDLSLSDDSNLASNKQNSKAREEHSSSGAGAGVQMRLPLKGSERDSEMEIRLRKHSPVCM